MIGVADENFYYDFLYSVESFDIANNEWKIEENLNLDRANHSCCASSEYIYIFGGFNHDDFI